jgi:hypothetical protein
MVNRGFLNKIKKYDSDEINEYLDLNEGEFTGTQKKYNIHKLFDVLHFILTGVSVNFPVKENKLSEAIVGINVFETDYDDIIKYTEGDKLPEICNAMKNVNIKELEEKFDLKILKDKKLYPKYMKTNKKDEIFKELINDYNGLLNFYQEAIEKNLHIIITIMF